MSSDPSLDNARLLEEIEALRSENERLKQKSQKAALSPEEKKNQQDDIDIVLRCLSEKSFSLVVLGASGDLAKKKTYPALYALYRQGLLPPTVNIVGYARSAMSDLDFRNHLQTKVLRGGSAEQLAHFLARCHYVSGLYDSRQAFSNLNDVLLNLERDSTSGPSANRLFYFAIPPSIYADVAGALQPTCLSTTGWNRVIVEKPFGRDMASFQELNHVLMDHFHEEQIYRIDHYLGKEMVQNLLTVRFGNGVFEPLWNRHYIQSVVITFKEDLDLQGRGGYFDHYGIIRDIMQNHLAQILSLVAMEPPATLDAEDIRDEKVKVLKSIDPLTLDRLVVGQFGPDEAKTRGGYLDDATVPQDSVTPTFAAAVLYVNNSRWEGVPFILKCGKGLNERKAEVRIRFKSVPGRLYRDRAPPNELVLRVQPDEAIYLKLVTKKPGLSTSLLQSELDLTYKSRGYPVQYDAYERLILDAIRGDHYLFVRTDELEWSWRIFTPVLHRLESERIQPFIYPFGIRSPPEADELIARHGYTGPSAGYEWKPPSGASL
eukprot:TRINITY_DN3359_c0_g1_i2.p1 TRINITY_DN3359_c0_g1~~TRINITY_DN3359_c0_g1_i2.p1  ORF type:complete len:545 (-),score=173.34 TRINITY_DN3359_c0_g1_i2:97-1731(-)